MPLTRIATLDLSKFTEFINSILSFIIDSNGSMTNASRLKLQPLMISQYFSDTTENLNAQIEEEISLILEILLRADKESYDTTKLETVLKQTDLTTAQRKVFVDIWGVSKEKIRRSVIRGSQWTYTLSGPDSVHWRVDRSVTSSLTADAAPTLANAAAVKCLLSLKLRGGAEENNQDYAGKALLLELNKAQVDEFLATLEIIQQQIDASA